MEKSKWEKKHTAGDVFDIVFARRGKLTDKVRCVCYYFRSTLTYLQVIFLIIIVSTRQCCKQCSRREAVMWRVCGERSEVTISSESGQGVGPNFRCWSMLLTALKTLKCRGGRSWRDKLKGCLSLGSPQCVVLERNGLVSSINQAQLRSIDPGR